MKPNISFEIHLLSVDADRDVVPPLSAFLAATSNPDDQRAGLQARAKLGSPALQTSGRLTLRVKPDSTVLRDLGTSAMRVSAHPHLDALGGAKPLTSSSSRPRRARLHSGQMPMSASSSATETPSS